MKPHEWTDDGDSVLILRRLDKNGKSKNGFDGWGPQETTGNVVTCPDWNPSSQCGGGLHGWPWGMGLGEGSDYSIIDDRWLVIAVRPEEVIGELENGLKCKFREGVKIFDGTFSAAWALINSGRHRLIQEMTNDSKEKAASGDHSSLAASGNCSKLAASGEYSKLAASGEYSNLAASGNCSSLAASGNCSKLAASGNHSNLAASGNCSSLAASGDHSKLAASGNHSKLAASGDHSNLAASGNCSSLAASGNCSKLAASGNHSICMASGSNSTAAAGKNGCIVLSKWIESEKRYRVVVGYVGEDGIEPNVFYRVDDNLKLVKS